MPFMKKQYISWLLSAGKEEETESVSLGKWQRESEKHGAGAVGYPKSQKRDDKYKHNVGKTMSCLPLMTGNGRFIPPLKIGDISGGWFIIVSTLMLINK